MENKKCEHKVDGVECWEPAVAVILIHRGRLLQVDPSKDELSRNMGRGVGSTYLPVCKVHRENYPDHEGFELDGKTKLS
jgi:hypothetical protein